MTFVFNPPVRYVKQVRALVGESPVCELYVCMYGLGDRSAHWVIVNALYRQIKGSLEEKKRNLA